MCTFNNVSLGPSACFLVTGSEQSGTTGNPVTIKVIVGSTLAGGTLVSEPVGPAGADNWGAYRVNWTTQLCNSSSQTSQILTPISGNYEAAAVYQYANAAAAGYFENLTPYPATTAATWTGPQNVYVTMNAPASTGTISFSLK
jgi:hypothetical protein